MILKNINGAIFDMDGTLIDSLMLWDIIWAKFGSLFCAEKSFAPTPNDDKAIRTMTLKDAMQFIHTKYNIGQSGCELLEIANKMIMDFYAEEVKLKEGVAEFLEYCHSKGIKMCIASATDMELVKTAVKHCNIEKYFVSILSCADIGKGKDEPDIYLKALESLGTTADETCIFEDSHIALRTATSPGMKTVGIYDKYNYGHDDLKRIAEILKKEGKKVIMQTVPPFDYNDVHAAVWNSVNDYILTELKNIVDYVFDNRGCLSEKEKTQNAIYGGHPNNEGCAVWANAFFENLKKDSIL